MLERKDESAEDSRLQKDFSGKAAAPPGPESSASDELAGGEEGGFESFDEGGSMDLCFLAGDFFRGFHGGSPEH